MENLSARYILCNSPGEFNEMARYLTLEAVVKDIKKRYIFISNSRAVIRSATLAPKARKN